MIPNTLGFQVNLPDLELFNCKFPNSKTYGLRIVEFRNLVGQREVTRYKAGEYVEAFDPEFKSWRTAEVSGYITEILLSCLECGIQKQFREIL